MNINNIKINLINNTESKIKAFASFTINDAIKVNDVKIIGYSAEDINAMPNFMHDLLSNPVVDGLHILISMPSLKTPDGKYRNIINLTNSEVANQLNSLILDAYKQAKQEA
ncbi:MAG: septation protein SpoVG family protein [Clostridia bacterium]|nr:septation protein SpoVG family protein [Clostridia bacterium]